jgi:hypothetical protein
MRMASLMTWLRLACLRTSASSQAKNPWSPAGPAIPARSCCPLPPRAVDEEGDDGEVLAGSSSEAVKMGRQWPPMTALGCLIGVRSWHGPRPGTAAALGV